MQTFTRARTRRSTSRPWLFDVLLAVVIGLVVALAKKHLDWNLGIPGHAGVGWIATLVVGSLVNPRRGMTILAGLSAGAWGGPMGLGHSLGYNAALYGAAGTALEALVIFRVPIHRWWGAATAGMIVHLTKYGFLLTSAWMSRIVRRFEIYGLLTALRNHVVFGIAGGLLGWAVYTLGSRVYRRRRRS